jgi:hypothetical protein
METLMIIFTLSGGIVLGIIGTLLYVFALLNKLDAKLTITVTKKQEANRV